MANAIGSRGFVPSRYRSGVNYTGATNLYHIPSSDINQYNPGDAVKSSPNADANGVPDIVKITNGTDTVRGVIVGILVSQPGSPSLMGINLDLTVQNTPGAGKQHDYYVMVADDPEIIFELQDDGGVALDATASNKNASFSVVNPTAPQQNSATVLNTGSVSTNALLNLRLMGLVRKPNNAFGVHASWLVAFNQHEYQGNTSGV
jgi:hypothetical protein